MANSGNTILGFIIGVGVGFGASVAISKFLERFTQRGNRVNIKVNGIDADTMIIGDNLEVEWNFANALPSDEVVLAVFKDGDFETDVPNLSSSGALGPFTTTAPLIAGRTPPVVLTYVATLFDMNGAPKATATDSVTITM